MRTPKTTTSPAESSVFTPDAVEVGARHVQVGGEWIASFAVVGYPREVHPGWLQPLLSYPGRLDVSLHIEPIDPTVAAGRLKKQLAKLESGRTHTAEHGRLLDPHVEAATEDAYDLSARLARGEGRLFRLGLYVTVHAGSETSSSRRSAPCGPWPPRCCWTPNRPPTAACRAGSRRCRWGWIESR